MSEVLDLKALVSADVSPFNKAMDSSADSVNASLSAINTAANAFISSGFIRTFIKATETAYKFGQVMADISSISDVSIKQLSSSIAKMENVYGRMSTIGDTIYETISSGIRGSEKDYINYTKTVGQTAKAIRADLEDTANILTTLTNAYDLSIGDAQKLSDMLFVTVREGKAHGNELAHTLGLVTNTAAEAGVSLAEMSAVISILSRTQSASQSMIGFNQMLNALIKPTQEATREARKWGIEIGATALQTKGLTAILTEMHEKVGGNVEAINAMLGNIRAMRAGTALTGKQFKNFIDVLRTAEREIGTGVAFGAFEKQTATSQQALENLRTQIDKTYANIGKDLEPVTKGMAEIAESILKSFTDASPITKWSTYVSALYVTFNAINKVVKDIRATMDAITGRNIGSNISNEITIAHMTLAKYKRELAAYDIANIKEPIAQLKQTYDVNRESASASYISDRRNYALIKRNVKDSLIAVRDGVYEARKELLDFDRNALVYSDKFRSLATGGHFKGNLTADVYEGYVSPTDVKDHYIRTQERMRDTLRQDQMLMSEMKKVLETKLSTEQEYGERLREIYARQIADMSKHVGELRASQAQVASAMQANEAKRAGLNVWDYTGSGALVGASMHTPSNVKSGSRTFYKSRMAQELSDATTQFTRMATEADIDAVLQKKLNPLKGEIESIAKSNIEEMYHIIRDDEGGVAETIDPLTKRSVDYEKVFKAETSRVSAGYTSARNMYYVFSEMQKEGVDNFESTKQALDKAIESQKAELESLTSAISSSTEEIEKSKATAEDSLKEHKSRLKATKGELRALSDAYAERRAGYQLELEEVRKQMRADIDAMRKTKAESPERAAIQSRIKTGATKVKDIQSQLRDLDKAHQDRRTAYDMEIEGLRTRLRADMGYIKQSKGNSTERLALQKRIAAEEDRLRMLEEQRLNLLKRERPPQTDASKVNLLGFEFDKDSKMGRFGNVVNKGASKFKAGILKVDEAFTKVASKLMMIPAAVSAWTMGYSIGEAIGKHLKLADTELVKWIAKLKIWNSLPGVDYLGNTKDEKTLTREENIMLNKLKETYSGRVIELETLGKLSASESALTVQQISLAKTLKELDAIYRQKILDEKKAKPKPKSAEDIWYETEEAVDKVKESKVLDAKSIAAMQKYASSQYNRLAAYGTERIIGQVDALDISRMATSDDPDKVRKDIVDKFNANAKPAYVGKYNWRAFIPDPSKGFIAGGFRDAYNAVIEQEFNAYVGMLNTVLSEISTKRKAMLAGTSSEASKRRRDAAIIDERKEGLREQLDAELRDYQSDYIALSTESTEAYKRRKLSPLKDTYGKKIAEYAMMDLTAAQQSATLNRERYTDLVANISKWQRMAASEGLSQKDIDTASSGAMVTLEAKYKQLLAAEDEIKNYADEVVKSSSDYLENVASGLELRGYAEDSSAYTTAMARSINSEIKRLTVGLSEASSDVVKQVLGKRIVQLRKELKGILEKGMERASQSTKIFAVMSDFMPKFDLQKNRRGGLDAQQLYHSLNLLSRMTGPSLVKSGYVPQFQVRNGLRPKDLRARADAENKVLASMDAYVMSQKYAEANVGKTVVDIYNFMRNNNTITVSR